MKRDTRLLTDPLFLAALALLVANDFLLKPLFHNALTGKLSDFAGLFVFPLFWTALWPRRKIEIHLACAAAFVLWKSPLAQPLLDAWNALSILPLARTVDASDLLALPSVALSFRYHAKSARAESHATTAARRWATCGAALVAVFAFTATSYHTEFPVENRHFVFADSKQGMKERLTRLVRNRDGSPLWTEVPSAYVDNFSLPFKPDCCCDRASAVVWLSRLDERRTRLALVKLEHDCPSEEEGQEQKLLAGFMREVVARLQDDIEANPPRLVETGEGAPGGRGARR